MSDESVSVIDAELADAQERVKSLSLQRAEVAETELVESSDRLVLRYQAAMDVKYDLLDRKDRIRVFVRMHSVVGRINLDLAWRIGWDLRQEREDFDDRKVNDEESRTWEAYVKEEFGLIKRTANRYIAIANFYRNREAFLNTFSTMDEAATVMRAVIEDANKKPRFGSSRGALSHGYLNLYSHIEEVEGHKRYRIEEFIKGDDEEPESEPTAEIESKTDAESKTDSDAPPKPEKTADADSETEPKESDSVAVFRSTLEMVGSSLYNAQGHASNLRELLPPEGLPDDLKTDLDKWAKCCGDMAVMLTELVTIETQRLDGPAAPVTDTSEDAEAPAKPATTKKSRKASKGKTDASTR